MKTLHNKKWYTPMEIAKLGLIHNSKGDGGTVLGHYYYILRLVKSGRLRAKNYSDGTQRNNWLVPEEAIQQYHDTITKV